MVRRRHQQGRWLTCGATVVVAMGLAVTLCGCRGAGGDPPSADLTQLPQHEPTVRVRIIADTDVASFDSPEGLWVGPASSAAWGQRRRRFAAPLTITRHAGRFALTAADGSAVTWALADLMVVGVSGHRVRVNATPYPHTLVLHAAADTGRALRFDVVNHVRLESYLPGVLQRELYASWHPAAFRAQAIAARSYALHKALHRRRTRYDLEATTADQAYGGAGADRKAELAVRSTAGLVLTHQGRLIPGYYSSCCGGTSQDAAAALADAPDIAPLRGGPRGGWCQHSPYFRWGPVLRPSATLARRIAAWGRAHRHAVADLKAIADLGVTRTNAAGRPTQFSVTDADGRTWTMAPEAFRFACNFDDDALPQLPASALLRSSHVRVSLDGAAVRFTAGRGFGHGVGLCQFGAQAMATQGHDEHQILSHYYPTAHITQVY